MKMTVILLIATFMQVSATGFAQRITLNKKNVSLNQVFAEIRKQTGFDVLWETDQLKGSATMDAKFDNTPLDEVIGKCLDGKPLVFTIQDKTVVIKEKEPSFLPIIPNDRRNLFIDAVGKIVDESGKPLEGATVVLKGTNRTVKTDAKGEFMIPNVPDDGVLVIRYVGFKTLEIPLQGAVLPLEIKLNVATGELEEVKVEYNTGYQKIPKERATGSFIQIDSELFNRGTSPTVLGRILEVTNSLRVEKAATNIPNSGTDISIRGFSTINANMKPLIVVDDFPYEEESETAGLNILNNLNPNDVESITVLRDAAAASIWGARSGNGVIVINTKKGKYNQKTSINFRSTLNVIEKPRLHRLNVINPMDAIEIEKKVFAAGGYNQYDDVLAGQNNFSTSLSPAVEIMLEARRSNKNISGYYALDDQEVLKKLAEIGSYDVRDDISKYLLQTAVNQQYSFDISGGNDKMNYYNSVGYNNAVPSDRGNKSDQLTLNFRSGYRPIKKLELNAFFTYTKRKNINNGIESSSYFPGPNSLIAPYTRLADENGNPLHVSRLNKGYRTPYIDTAKYPTLLDWHYRPLDEINSNDNTSNLNQLRFGGDIKYELISGLNIQLQSYIDKTLLNTNNYQSLENYETRNMINRFIQRGSDGIITYPIPRNGILDYQNSERTNWNVRGKINFNKTWTLHSISAFASAEVGQLKTNSNGGRYYGYDKNTATIFTAMDYITSFPLRASGGSSGKIGSSGIVAGILDRSISYSANAAYTFNNKYTVSGSGRFDARNFFGSNANQRVTPLWSSGISWDVSRESFYKLRWLPKLKLRATYGYNANLASKATPLPTATYRSPDGVFHNEIYLALTGPANPGLTWEKIKNINLAIEYCLFDQRITGSFEYYIKKGINLIGTKLLEPTIGFSSYDGNYASMITKGFDINLHTINTIGSLNWSTGFNFSYNTDKITNYELSISEKNNVSTRVSSPSFLVLGKPRIKVYSYPSAGLDPLNGQPRGYVNGEVVGFNQVLASSSSGGANPSDLIYHGSGTPQLFGNIMNRFNFKNKISLSFNILYSLNYYIRGDSYLAGNWGNASGNYYLRWQKPGDEIKTFIPSFPNSLTNSASFYSRTNTLVIKGDHIQLSDFQLSYNINKQVLKRLPFSSASLTFTASSLGMILWKVNNHGVNPLNPNASYQPPVSRSIAFGLDLNF